MDFEESRGWSRSSFQGCQATEAKGQRLEVPNPTSNVRILSQCKHPCLLVAITVETNPNKGS